MSKAEILRKLTIKGCGLAIAEIKKALVKGKDDKGEPIFHDKIDLLKIVGIVNSAKPDSTDKGEFLRLMGTFTAVNMLTGETFNASQCILPDFVAAPLGGALSGGSNEVQFAVLIGVKHAPTSVTGYQYFARPLIDAKPSDAMQSLLLLAGVDAPRVTAETGTDPTPAPVQDEPQEPVKAKSKK